MLSDEMREALLHGPPNGYRNILRYGGAAHCPRVNGPGTAPSSWPLVRLGVGLGPFWLVELPCLKTRAAGELGELRALRSLEHWRR